MKDLFEALALILVVAFGLAVYFLFAGEPDWAVALLGPVVSRDSSAFDLRWLEAGITGEAGRASEAVTLYERLSVAFPHRAG